MGKEYHTSYIPYIEETIKKSPELSKQFITDKKVSFNIGDYVECTYIHGLYKILSYNPSFGSVTLRAINAKSNTFTVSTDFIRLYEGNSNAIKVLFEP